MRPNKWKWQVIKGAKDAIAPKEEPGSSSLHHRLQCDCAKVYIGETHRTAKQRLREHKSHTRTGHLELSAIADHVHERGHTIHWEPHILAKEKAKTKRKIKEVLANNKIPQASRWIKTEVLD